jgi:hypothetical protein
VKTGRVLGAAALAAAIILFLTLADIWYWHLGLTVEQGILSAGIIEAIALVLLLLIGEDSLHRFLSVRN